METNLLDTNWAKNGIRRSRKVPNSQDYQAAYNDRNTSDNLETNHIFLHLINRKRTQKEIDENSIKSVQNNATRFRLLGKLWSRVVSWIFSIFCWIYSCSFFISIDKLGNWNRTLHICSYSESTYFSFCRDNILFALQLLNGFVTQFFNQELIQLPHRKRLPTGCIIFEKIIANNRSEIKLNVKLQTRLLTTCPP